MERIIMKRNEYVIPSVEVVNMYMEESVLLGKSDEWTPDMGSQKRRPNATSSTGIWNNNQND